ncbi:MAG: Sec-independent protein translocase protein TatB [Chromatocurvus sp.]
MFDIGFAELIIISVVGLLVIGPERLPGAIRTASVWLGRLRRGFNDIKREVQQELHNDEVMQELRRTGEQVKQQTDDLRKSLSGASDLSGESGESNLSGESDLSGESEQRTSTDDKKAGPPATPAGTDDPEKADKTTS